MRRVVRLVFLLWCALASLHAAHAASPPTILVFGDSISAAYGISVEDGWVALLQKKLTSQGYGYRVVNASVSGETTGGGAARLPRALELHRPAIVILELGGNDGLRGLPVEEVRANLDSMIRKSRAAGARVLIVGMRMPPNYGPAYSQKFQALYADLAQHYRAPFVPFLLQKVALNGDLMQTDGIHPTARAQPALLDTIWPALEPLLGR
jgi:acyl-CoA thioesterase-1